MLKFQIYPLAKFIQKGSDRDVKANKKQTQGSALLLTKTAKSKYRHDFEHFFHQYMDVKLLADEAQYAYAEAILASNKEVQAVVSDSPAGTGKTFIALASAYYQLSKGNISKIIYVRNTVSVRENGFLPGTIEDKESAYMKPAYDVIQKIGAKLNNQNLFDDLIASEELVCTSTSFLRGVDYDMDAILIIDEAQNLDLTELQTVLTRPHDNVKVVMIGSSLQNDNAKMRKYGPEKLLPFQVYIKHYTEQSPVPVKHINLTTNYRGRFANFSDQINQTVLRLEGKPQEKNELPSPCRKRMSFIEEDNWFTAEPETQAVPFYGLESF